MDSNQSRYPLYGGRLFKEALPSEHIPQEGCEPRVAHQLIKDEMSLDGLPTLNLASFVTTWMDEEADKLIVNSLNKNFVDADEYPQSQVIHARVVKMLGNLYHAPEGFTGTATIGSSEAVMLAGLSYKWLAKKRGVTKPNIVMSTGVQVVWHKFARYFEVEEKLVPMEEGKYTLDPLALESVVDENTIAVVSVLGITETGQFDDVKAIAKALDEIEEKKGFDIPLHVDAASGGFVAPFVFPNLEWDFRINRVKGINISGHKYGLVYPGIGWMIWRSEKDLDEELIFHLNYLGGDEPTFTLNFSRGSSHIIAQYYNFVKLGKEGYRLIMENLHLNAKYLEEELEKLGFETVSKGDGLPVVTVSWANGNLFDLSGEIRKRGWIVPAYTMPKNCENIVVMRIVVREGLSRDMCGRLIADIKHAMLMPKEKPRTGHRVC
ncbi:MAG: Glutamate decarboxylase [Chlamydiia bacterium]|nr:Glutamate decarboxylase [Chlamydiia bacterium]MCH9616012.1 Glutamate decarboxylase [Chlamydiia bacterium]MCH9629035.1 Glutamate decarboxylase [Chlamydiia bacterium]